ncbi:MAG TPA: TlpA disulfide reductase family protein [Chitinophagaceae bacterium]|nr:TlpA disulfide reductase family protein [Chitinophagaceae bacterium]
MRTFSFSLLFFLYSSLFAQDEFTITGTIELLSKAQKIKINCSGGQFIGDINKDGSFTIKGNVPEPGAGLIFTDSSGADAIWLEEGPYNIGCKEVTMGGIKGYLFRIPELKGPRDAEIYNAWNEPRYYFHGSPDELRKKYKDHTINYLDSLFNNFPQCKAIPEILRMDRLLIGDDAALYYMSMLNKEQLKDGNYTSLQNYFKRKEKIEKEIYFMDFQMKDRNGNTFKLSSLNKKLVLLDFWSSDCGPCRRKHPKLAALYKKYASKGFEIVSVSFDDTKEDWLKAIAKDNMIWINVSELKGWKTSLSEDYFIKSIPFAIWLDKDKKIISTIDLSEKEIEEYLK